MHSDNNIIREVKNYTKGAEGDAQVQTLNPPQLAFLPRALSYRGVGISTGDAGPSNSGVASWDIGPRMSQISIEKLASMAREYRLGDLAR